MRGEQVGDRGDRDADAAEHRMPVPRVADREREHLVEFPGAVVAQQEQPGVDCRRNRGGQRAGPRHELEALSAVVLWGRAGRRRALPHQHDRDIRMLRRGEHTRHVAARTVEVRLDHVQHECAGDGGVEGVAAALEHGLRGSGCQPVRRCGHAERALQRGTGGERARRSVGHGPTLAEVGPEVGVDRSEEVG